MYILHGQRGQEGPGCGPHPPGSWGNKTTLSRRCLGHLWSWTPERSLSSMALLVASPRNQPLLQERLALLPPSVLTQDPHPGRRRRHVQPFSPLPSVPPKEPPQIPTPWPGIVVCCMTQALMEDPDRSKENSHSTNLGPSVVCPAMLTASPAPCALSASCCKCNLQAIWQIREDGLVGGPHLFFGAQRTAHKEKVKKYTTGKALLWQDTHQELQRL